MDAEDPLLAERKALPARGVAPQRWKRFPAHAYQNTAQSGIHGIDHPARYPMEGQGLRVFVNQAGKDDHRATPGYVPLGQTIQQGCERRRAPSKSASERLGTRMFPIALLVRDWQAEASKGKIQIRSPKEGPMCPACIASTAVMVAGAGSTGGILAVCIGKFRKFYRVNRLGLFQKSKEK
jgi:hypothetical protein